MTPQAADRADRRDAAEASRGFPISFDHCAFDHSPENIELVAGHLPQAARPQPSLIDTKTIEQFFDPVKGMFLPDRYIKGSARSAARRTSTATRARLRLDLRADRPHRIRTRC